MHTHIYTTYIGIYKHAHTCTHTNTHSCNMCMHIDMGAQTCTHIHTLHTIPHAKVTERESRKLP